MRSGNLRSFEAKLQVRRGPMNRDTCECDMSSIDECTFQRLCSTLVAGSSDGCEVEVQANMKLAKTKLKGMKYYFRDRCHTTNSSHKAVLGFQRPEDTELIAVLIDGPQAWPKGFSSPEILPGSGGRPRTQKLMMFTEPCPA